MYPILFKIGKLNIYSYGVMVALGFLSGILITLSLSKKYQISKDEIWSLAGNILIFSLIGARLFFVISHWGLYKNNFLGIFKIWEGGLVFSGGIFAGILTLIFYSRKKRISFFKLADLFAPGLALGQGIGRIGCFLAGCCYGLPTSLPWAVIFNNPLALAQPLGIGLHPTQLYSCIGNIILFFYLFFKAKKQKFLGEIFANYLLLYGIGRFLIEFIRGDNKGELFFGFAFLTATQWFALGMIIFSIIFLKRNKIRK